MEKYNANISFTSCRGHARLVLLATLKGKTIGEAVNELVAKEIKRLGIKIKVWGDK